MSKEYKWFLAFLFLVTFFSQITKAETYIDFIQKNKDHIIVIEKNNIRYEYPISEKEFNEAVNSGNIKPILCKVTKCED
jgi:hypothetical protein